jgi:hypothetical protein
MKIKLIQHQNYNNMSNLKSHQICNHNNRFKQHHICSHIRVAIIGANNNRLTNKCTTTNKGIRSTTIDSKNNRELTFDSIRIIVYA